MKMSDEAFKAEVLRQLKQLADGQATMNRGLYGEKENQTPGLIARMLTAEQKLRKLFSDRKKVIWVGGTAVLIAGGIVEAIKHFL